MIEAKVRVVSRQAGELHVVSTEQSGCGGCASRNVCGVSGLAKYFSGGRQPVVLPCDANVAPGEELHLLMSEGDLLKAGLMAYLVPSLFAIGCAAGVTAAGYGDAWAVLGAVGGVLLGLLLMRALHWMPRISALPHQSTHQGEST